MEFRKMETTTLYERQQKIHRYIEQSFALCGKGWAWDDLGEWHWNMYIIICETRPGFMHDTGCSGLVHWDDPEGCDGEGGGRGVQDDEHMSTHGWFMSMYGKNHYNVVKYSLQLNKLKKKLSLDDGTMGDFTVFFFQIFDKEYILTFILRKQVI